MAPSRACGRTRVSEYVQQLSKGHSCIQFQSRWVIALFVGVRHSGLHHQGAGASSAVEAYWRRYPGHACGRDYIRRKRTSSWPNTYNQPPACPYPRAANCKAKLALRSFPHVAATDKIQGPASIIRELVATDLRVCSMWAEKGNWGECEACALSRPSVTPYSSSLSIIFECPFF